MVQSKLYVSASDARVYANDRQCQDKPTPWYEMQCLVQPRFFCGQLLTDQDLNALLQWSRGKLRRDRHKTGWGVVCGLHLRCDPDRASGLIVDPGFAVDSCGEEVVVCEPNPFDLADACRLPDSHCQEFTATEEGGPLHYLGLEISPGAMVALDVFIHYAEEEAQPLPALGRNSCSERDACEFSRLRETHTLEWRFANQTESPVHAALLEWEAAYFSESRRVVDAYLERFGDVSPGDHLAEIKCWLLGRIEHHGLKEFCLLPDAIRQLQTHQEDLPARVARIVFWLVVDARLAYLALACPCGDAQKGVPLGRVHLRRRAGQTSACQIVHIDSARPYRRWLARDLGQAPLGHADLGQFFWQPVDWVCEQLMDMGVNAELEDIQMPPTVVNLRQWLDKEWTRLFLDLGCETTAIERPLRLQAFRDSGSGLGTRVLSFSCESVEHPSRERPRRPQLPAREPPQRPAQERAPAETQPPDEPQPTEEVGPDLLMAINGIGQEREFQLRQHGITTYKQLYDTETADLQALFPRIKKEVIEDWKDQAMRLHQGE